LKDSKRGEGERGGGRGEEIEGIIKRMGDEDKHRYGMGINEKASSKQKRKQYLFC
jgi:hypothetical protein